MADRALGRRTTRIIANAEAVRRFLIESIGLPAGKIRVIRNGLDLGEFDAAAAREPSAPTPETSGAPVIGTVGRLEPQKGTCYLLDAFARLPPETGPAELWVIGGGPDLEPLRSQAQALGVAARVRFLGPRPDVPALLGRLDLFVLPSLWEGLPNAALEAMAARRAVVATNVDGTPEAVADGVTGLLVPPADADALARAIAILLRDPERRGTLAEAGRRRVEREFGMDRMVAETQQVYREAMAEVRA
jgi:glycosyltransferase involved in cell wall biosynthesis